MAWSFSNGLVLVVGVVAACASDSAGGSETGSDSANTTSTTSTTTGSTAGPDTSTGCEDDCTDCASHDECAGNEFCDGRCNAAEGLEECGELVEFEISVPEGVSADQAVDLVFTQAGADGIADLVILHPGSVEFVGSDGRTGEIATLEGVGVVIQNADVDGDGDDDLIVASNTPNGGAFGVLRREAPDWPPDPETAVDQPIRDMLVSDLNADDEHDLVIRLPDELRIYNGVGDGSFTLETTIAESVTDVALTHGPGPQDAALVIHTAQGVSLVSTDGTLFPLEEASAASARFVRAADFTDDGVYDIVAVRGSIGGSLLAQWDGATLALPQYRFAPPTTLALEVIDVDGDGIDEMIAGEEMGVSIWQGGTGSESPIRCYVHIPTPRVEFPHPGGVVAADSAAGVVSIAYTDGGALTLMRTI